MLRRLLTVVMAMAIASAPVALELCQVSCAVHDAMSAPPQHEHAGHSGVMAAHHENGHSCHDMVMPAPAAAAPSSSIAGLPHACAHSDDLPLSSGAVALVALTPRVVVASALDLMAPGVSVRPVVADAAGKRAARIVLTAQLRV